MATNHSGVLETKALGTPAPNLSIQRLVVRLAAHIALFRERARQRRTLLGLSDELLMDIGLTRKQAQREAEKPFWVA